LKLPTEVAITKRRQTILTLW